MNTAANGLPDADMRVLIAQVTTSGAISGQMNYQVFPLGVGADQQQISIAFEGAGTYGAGGGGNACGCTDDEFLNYNSYATNDFGCSNILGSADLNGDGEVDASDLNDFLTVYGTQSDELYGSNFGSQCLTDALGVDELESIVCSGCCPESGCMYSTVMNFDPAATLDAGSCVFGGCTDQAAQNYNALANEDDNSCLYEVCPDFTGDGEVTLMDFLAFLVGYIGEGLNVDTNDGGDADDGGGMNTLVGDGN